MSVVSAAVPSRLNQPLSLTVVGSGPPREVTDLELAGVHVTGGVPDLVPFFDRARVFVAPTRFAAGIPLKVGHAAAHGLPVVATSLLARQLGWTHDQELLVADSPEEFAEACRMLYLDSARWHRLRETALTRVADEYSTLRFHDALFRALPTIDAVSSSNRTINV